MQITKVDSVGPIIDNNKAGEVGEGDDDANALGDNQDLDIDLFFLFIFFFTFLFVCLFACLLVCLLVFVDFFYDITWACLRNSALSRVTLAAR